MEKKHILNDVWNNYQDKLAIDDYNIPLQMPSVEKLIAEMFSVGEFYYYVLNLSDSSLHNCHDNVLKMHGLKKYPQHLNDIIELIHPDDIPFVIEAERMAVEKMVEIGFENHMNLKSSYCFRMKTADDGYQLFHHQALHTMQDDKGRLVQSVNIHTNINHLTPANNYSVLVSGVGGRTDLHQMYYQKPEEENTAKFDFTRREKEILHLLAQGFSSREISEQLNLSVKTIQTHRKNILKKTRTGNSIELVRKCVEYGYI